MTHKWIEGIGLVPIQQEETTASGDTMKDEQIQGDEPRKKRQLDPGMAIMPKQEQTQGDAKEEWKNVVIISEGNWPEDYEHENGRYQNRCVECKNLFYGHKRRPICKVCANKPIDWETMAKKQPPTQHESWAWQGCWADGEMTGFARCMVKKVIPLESELQSLRDQLAVKDKEIVSAGQAVKNAQESEDRIRKELQQRGDTVNTWIQIAKSSENEIKELKEALKDVFYIIKNEWEENEFPALDKAKKLIDP